MIIIVLVHIKQTCLFQLVCHITFLSSNSMNKEHTPMIDTALDDAAFTKKLDLFNSLSFFSINRDGVIISIPHSFTTLFYIPPWVCTLMHNTCICTFIYIDALLLFPDPIAHTPLFYILGEKNLSIPCLDPMIMQSFHIQGPVNIRI